MRDRTDRAQFISGALDALGDCADSAEDGAADLAPGITAPPVEAQHVRSESAGCEAHDDPAPQAVDAFGGDPHPEGGGDNRGSREVGDEDQLSVSSLVGAGCFDKYL